LKTCRGKKLQSTEKDASLTANNKQAGGSEDSLPKGESLYGGRFLMKLLQDKHNNSSKARFDLRVRTTGDWGKKKEGEGRSFQKTLVRSEVRPFRERKKSKRGLGLGGAFVRDSETSTMKGGTPGRFLEKGTGIKEEYEEGGKEEAPMTLGVPKMSLLKESHAPLYHWGK